MVGLGVWVGVCLGGRSKGRSWGRGKVGFRGNYRSRGSVRFKCRGRVQVWVRVEVE